MAQATNTSDTYDVGSSGGNREDLGDVIWDLFPADTYALSTFPHESASATLHEWLGDELAAAGSNAQIEGDVTDATAISPPARYGNYQQIFKKVFNISATQEVVTKAGRSSEVARESMKQMREIKRDMEYAFTRNQIGTAGGAGTARTTAGMEAWIGGTASSTVATHVILSTTTASATTVAVTSGVLRTSTSRSRALGRRADRLGSSWSVRGRRRRSTLSRRLQRGSWTSASPTKRASWVRLTCTCRTSAGIRSSCIATCGPRLPSVSTPICGPSPSYVSRSVSG
jgi:hypothetical protein